MNKDNIKHTWARRAGICMMLVYPVVLFAITNLSIQDESGLATFAWFVALAFYWLPVVPFVLIALLVYATAKSKGKTSTASFANIAVLLLPLLSILVPILSELVFWSEI